MPALSVVAAGGDADRTNFTCSRSPSAWSSALRRRNPSAARSLLRKPPLRSWTCGASSGRRLMAPASLHNNCEAAPWTRERWSSMPDAWAGLTPASPGRYRRSTATPTTACRKLGTAPVNDRVPPLLVPRSRSNLQHHPDRTPVDPWFSYCRACATGPRDFAPAHPIAGGSGGRSQRSLP
jgi:hypothetical protein